MLIELMFLMAPIVAPEIQGAHEADHGYAQGVMLVYRLTNETGAIRVVTIEASPDGKDWARYVYKVHPREIIECSPWITCNSWMVTNNRPSVLFRDKHPKMLRVRINGVEQLAPVLVQPLRPEHVRGEICLTPT